MKPRRPWGKLSTQERQARLEEARRTYRRVAVEEMSVDDRCRCGHFRDQHRMFAGPCRTCSGCHRFRDPREEPLDPGSGEA